MSMAEFLNADPDVGMREFIPSSKYSRPHNKKKFKRDGRLSGGRGRSSHRFPSAPGGHRPSLRGGSRPPPMPPVPPMHPPSHSLPHHPIPTHITAHHPSFLPHRLPPPPVPTLPKPPSHPYGSHSPLDSQPPPPPLPPLPPPPISQMLQTSVPPPPLPHEPPSIPKHAPPPLPTHQVPPPLPISEAAPHPPPPPDKFKMQPPLPPLPPLPPEVNDEHSKPPPPMGPPPTPNSSSKFSRPLSYVKHINMAEAREMPNLSKAKLPSSSSTLTKNNVTGEEEPKPIPSIVTPRMSSNTQSKAISKPPCSAPPPVLATVVPSNPVRVRDSTPPPPPLPTSLKAHARNQAGRPPRMIEDVYDPEDAMFSPTPSLSPSEDEMLINKYVKQSRKVQAVDNCYSSVTDQERNGRDRNKKVSFSRNISPPENITKSQPESPARLDLDTRLKTIFGGGSDDEKSPKKAKKSSNPVQPKEEDDASRPLSPTPSPFLSRSLYLYWHNETLKMRQESKPIHVEVASTRASSDKSVQKLNGQVRSTALPHRGIPPLPMNLPTVPPPNYKSSLVDSFSLKEGNFKFDMLKNMKRMHPYKVNESKITYLKNPIDTELELTSAPACDSYEERMSSESQASESDETAEETVHLVMTKILNEFKSIIRKELTSDLIDSKVQECLQNISSS